MAEPIESRFAFVNRLPQRIEWLSDNGSAYTAHQTPAFATMMALEVRATPVHTPESSGMAQSFIKTFKWDYVNINPLNDATTVMKQLPQWFENYNNFHPHKALEIKSPRK